MPVTRQSYSVYCVYCKETAETEYKRTKFCSNDCASAYAREKHGRERTFPVATATVGAISELEVAAYLMKQGYSVFRALSPACFCDLIAIKDGEIISLEVRTGYRSLTGNLAYPTKVRGNVDMYAIYVPPENQVILIPIKK